MSISCFIVGLSFYISIFVAGKINLLGEVVKKMVPSWSNSTSRSSISPDRSSYNSISVVVSEDDSDEAASKMRFKVKRKRRYERPSLQFRTLRKIWKCWILLLLLPVVGLFFFVLIKTSHRQNTSSDILSSNRSQGRIRGGKEMEKAEKEGESNLNRLDMPTRSVNGVRVPCLKLLPLEDIEQLELPFAQTGGSPIRNIAYEVLESTTDGDNSTYLKQSETESQNFNLFTGYQTLQERQESFKVRETMTVHCAFCSDHGGFDIDSEDKIFMNSCKAVVSTCTFGGGDDLYQPIGMSQASLRKVCYVAFWDEITLLEQEKEGKKLSDNRTIGLWHIVVVRNLPFTDQRLNGKIPKMLSHRLFPQARYSIWVDSKSQFRRDPIGVFEALLWRTNSVLAISEHGARSCVYDEGNAIVKKNKATPEEVHRQLTQYRLDGFPKDARFGGHKALAEASVIVREHTPITNLLMCLWFNEVVRFTSRDQLSFPFVLKHLPTLQINMFPVCTRRALVNSMGHKHKAKPLIRQA
ncbi:probable hexosyltransferase MUCI70 [Cryptomeria japonica]|uniref:probable hexosyltransferase MUCI70 n=1 Tax=Cryptomeria japonica TaxID=3369 RepID=UPI0027DA5E12|nr:probable hexosyltransferase MUCI70 [Cryptomeria japonica]